MQRLSKKANIQGQTNNAKDATSTEKNVKRMQTSRESERKKKEATSNEEGERSRAAQMTADR